VVVIRVITADQLLAKSELILLSLSDLCGNVCRFVVEYVLKVGVNLRDLAHKMMSVFCECKRCLSSLAVGAE